MRKLTKAASLGVIGLGLIATSGIASANGFDRTAVNISIGGFSIGLNTRDRNRSVVVENCSPIVIDRRDHDRKGDDRREHFDYRRDRR